MRCAGRCGCSAPQMARLAHAACTVALATTQWKRLAKMVEDSGIASDGAAWAKVGEGRNAGRADVDGHCNRATGRQGRARADARSCTSRSAVRQRGRQGAHTRLLLNLGFDGAIVRGRPNGSWNNSEYPWSVAERLDAGRHRRCRCRAPALPSWPATTSLASARLQPPTCSGGPAGPPVRRSERLAAIGAVEVDLDDDWRRRRLGAARRRRRRGQQAMDRLPAGARFDDDGLEGSRVVPRRPRQVRRPGVRRQRQCRADDLGRRSQSSAAGRNASPVRSPIKLLADVPAKRVKSIGAEAERLRDLIGDARVNVRFPRSNAEGAAGLMAIR